MVYAGGSTSQRSTDECGVSFEESDENRAGEERTPVEKIISSIHLRRCTHVPCKVPSGARSRTGGIMNRRQQIKDRHRQEQVEAVRSDDSKR